MSKAPSRGRARIAKCREIRVTAVQLSREKLFFGGTNRLLHPIVRPIGRDPFGVYRLLTLGVFRKNDSRAISPTECTVVTGVSAQGQGWAAAPPTHHPATTRAVEPMAHAGGRLHLEVG